MSKKRYELRKQVKSVRWMIFWVVLAQLAAEMAMQAVTSFMAQPPHEYIQIAIVELFAIGVPIMVYGKSVWSGNGKNVAKELMLNKCKPDLLCYAAVIGVSGQFVMMALNIPANLYIQEVLQKEATDAIPVALSIYEMLLGSLAVVIIPAVLEEFWLRGILFRAYNDCNTAAAVIFSTMVFALLHMRLNEVAGFIFMGLMAAFVLIRCQSLYAAMIYHAFSNLTALTFGFILADVVEYIWIIFAVALLIFAAGVVLLFARGKRVRATKEFKQGRLLFNSVFSIPVVLSVILLIIKFLLAQ